MLSTPPGERLPAERAEALAQLAALHREHTRLVQAAEGSNADDEHDPEGATIAFERAQLDALTAAAQQRLTDLDAALGRLAAGGYGVCERCGEPIAAGRLAARPATRTCIGCADG